MAAGASFSFGKKSHIFVNGGQIFTTFTSYDALLRKYVPFGAFVDIVPD